MPLTSSQVSELEKFLEAAKQAAATLSTSSLQKAGTTKHVAATSTPNSQKADTTKSAAATSMNSRKADTANRITTTSTNPRKADTTNLITANHGSSVQCCQHKREAGKARVHIKPATTPPESAHKCKKCESYLRTISVKTNDEPYILPTGCLLYTTENETTGLPRVVHVDPFSGSTKVDATGSDFRLLVGNEATLLIVREDGRTIMQLFDPEFKIGPCIAVKDENLQIVIEHTTAYRDGFYMLGIVDTVARVVKLSVDVDTLEYQLHDCENGFAIEDIRTGTLTFDRYVEVIKQSWLVLYVKIGSTNYYVNGRKLYKLVDGELDYLSEYRVMKVVDTGCYVVEIESKQDLLLLTDDSIVSVATSPFPGPDHVYYSF